MAQIEECTFILPNKATNQLKGITQWGLLSKVLYLPPNYPIVRLGLRVKTLVFKNYPPFVK